MRIIGGSASGRTLRAPSGAHTRPTSDRVREALFSILGPPPEKARVLDLFAGSGALGLEALSRGAQRAIFADQSKAALQTLERNIRDLGFAESTEVHRSDALKLLARLEKGSAPFHWIFIDPPYATALAHDSLQVLGVASLLAEEGQIVVEHDRRSPPDEVYASLVKVDDRRYGDTCLAFYERKSE